MSREYYTTPPRAFEEAKALLLANLGEFKIAPIPSRYVPECEAFFVRAPSGAGFWILKETRASHLVAPGALIMEVMMGSQKYVSDLMPWIEKTLGVVVYDELGLPWSDR